MHKKAESSTGNLPKIAESVTNIGLDLPTDKNQVFSIQPSPVYSADNKINIANPLLINKDDQSITTDPSFHFIDEESPNESNTLQPKPLKEYLRRNIATSQKNNPLLFANRKNRHQIILEKSNLKQFPIFLSTSPPQDINSIANHIIHLSSPDSLDSMEILRLNQNLIPSIPPTIKSLSNLKELHLSKNCITVLPNELFESHNLINLVLSYNQITKIPYCIGKLIKLESLEIQGNLFQTLPTSFINLLGLERLGLEWFLYVSKERIVIAEDRNIDLLRSFKMICGKYKTSTNIDFLIYMKESLGMKEDKLISFKYDGKDRNLLHMAAMNNHLAIAQCIMPIIFNLNAVDNDGSTALLLAVLYKSEAIANILLAAPRITTYICNTKYGSMLNLAIENELFVSAEIMLKRDSAYAHLKDTFGNSPLHLIMRKFNSNSEVASRICDLLIHKHQCHLNEQNKNGYSPFLLAAKKGQLEAVAYAIKHNKSNKNQFRLLHAGGKERMTALHFAASYSNIKMIRLLLKHGLDIFERDAYNKRPSQYCLQLNIKKYLIKVENESIYNKFFEQIKLRDISKLHIQALYKNKINANLFSNNLTNESCFMDNYDMQEGLKNTVDLYSHTKTRELGREKSISVRKVSNKYLLYGGKLANKKLPRSKEVSPSNICISEDKTDSIIPNFNQATSPGAHIHHNLEKYILMSNNSSNYKRAVFNTSFSEKYRAIYSLFTKIDDTALYQVVCKLPNNVTKCDAIYALSLLNSTKYSNFDWHINKKLCWSSKCIEMSNCIYANSCELMKYIPLFLMEFSKGQANSNEQNAKPRSHMNMNI